MFVAVEPMTETVAGQVVTHPAGAPLIRWQSFSGAVRRALLNHGTVREVGEAPDLAPDLDPEQELPVEGDHRRPASADFGDDADGEEAEEEEEDGDEDESEEGPLECRKVVADGVPCPHCADKVFATKRALSQHLRWSHKGEP